MSNIGGITPTNREQWNRNKIFGVYRGVIEYTVDPMKLGRVKVRVPNLHSTEKSVPTADLPWAYPMHHFGGGHDYGSYYVPPVGSTVFVQFEMGDPEHPIYFGTWWKVPFEIREMNTKTSSETKEVLPKRPISMGQWYQPVGPEPPQEVLASPYEPTVHILHKCHAFGARVITEDLRWVPVEELKTGDRLLAFDEYPLDKNGRRGWRGTLVTSAEHGFEECFKIKLSNGDEITTTYDHPHLVSKTSKRRLRWVETKNLVVPGEGNGNGHCSKLAKVINIPTNGSITEFERGYISGAFDADGSFGAYTSRSNGFKKDGKDICGTSFHLVIGQVDNILLSRVEEILTKANYQVSIHKAGGKNRENKNWKDFYYLHILGGKSEIIRFLSEFRPPRLLERFSGSVDKIGRLLTIETPEVVSIESVGVVPIVRLGTDSATYIAEGYATHNTQKGHTVLFEDRDGYEKIRIIDRSGQEIRMTSPVTDGMNDFNASQRGTKSVVSGDNIPYDDMAGGTATIEILGASGQGVRIVSKENSEFVEISSKDDKNKTSPSDSGNVLRLLLGGGLGIAELVGKRDGEETVRLSIDLHSGHVELRSNSSLTISSPLLTLISEILTMKGELSLEGSLMVKGDASFVGTVTGIEEAR